MELDRSSNCEFARSKNVEDGIIGNGPLSDSIAEEADLPAGFGYANLRESSF
jgi:hypothetical protein